MCSVCPIAIEERVDRMTAKERKFLADLRRRMNQGAFEDQYIELFVSRTGGSYTLSDAYVFGRLAARYWQGRIMICQVGFLDPVSGPEADRDVAENRAMLARLVPPFRGTVEPGHDGDGMIFWDRPILMGRQIDGGDGDTIEEACEVMPGGILLEIGKIHTYNGIHRLEQESGMARWPYDSDVVTIPLRHESDTLDPE